MKIKISKKVWLIVGIAVFIIALVALVRVYSQQAGEQGELETSLAQQQAVLRRLATDKTDLEDKLAAAQSLFDTSRAQFPVAIESIEYGEDLFEIAEDCNLELTSLSPSMPGAKTGGAVTYSVASFGVQVQGDMEDILDFIYALRTGDGFKLPWSAEVNSVSMEISEEGATATINMDIYGYRG